MAPGSSRSEQRYRLIGCGHLTCLITQKTADAHVSGVSAGGTQIPTTDYRVTKPVLQCLRCLQCLQCLRCLRLASVTSASVATAVGFAAASRR